MIDIFIPCNPPRTGKKNSHGAVIMKKGGKSVARVFKRKEAQEVEQTWLSLLKPFAPHAPLEGALQLSVILVFPLNVGDTNTAAKRKVFDEQDWVWHPSRPDASNLIEAIQDAMGTALFYNDDAQICDVRCRKQRGKRPGLHVQLGVIP